MGVLKGDIIIQVGEYKVKNIAELRYYLYKYEPNEKVELKLVRDNKEETVSIILGESK